MTRDGGAGFFSVIMLHTNQRRTRKNDQFKMIYLVSSMGSGNFVISVLINQYENLDIEI